MPKPPHKSNMDIIKGFAMESSFHGIRFIAEESSHASRRIAWVIVVVAFVGAFGFVIVNRISHYLDHPAVVNMDSHYEDTMTMPIITVCNQKQFSMTELLNNGLYDVVVNAYTTPTNRVHTYSNRTRAFVLQDDICQFPTSDAVFSYHYNDTTTTACQRLCDETVSDFCSGVFYDHVTRTCTLTSFTGEMDDVTRNASACDKSLLKYYRRHRVLEAGSLHYDFEYETGLTSNTSRDALWKRVTRILNKVDNTLNSDQGHFLYLPAATGTRYTAEVLTGFFDTTGKCLTLALVVFTGNPNLIVSVVSEDLHRSQHGNTVKYSHGVWDTVFVRLPAGVHRVSLVGERVFPTVGSMAIDDVTIRPCHQFSENCVRTFSGAEYNGTMSATRSGRPCVAWSETAFRASSVYRWRPHQQLWYGLAGDGQGVSHNRCRNVAATQRAPFCYVNADEWEECAVPYCDDACHEDAFRCDRGFCITRDLLCNGVDNCGDNSDESSTVCRDKISLACNFSGSYACGYRADDFDDGVTRWVRYSYTLLRLLFVPYPRETTLRYTSSLRSVRGASSLPGDRATTRSAFFTVSAAVRLKIWYVSKYAAYDTVSSLAVTLISAATARRHRMAHVLYAELSLVEMCLPVGRYSVEFESTAGFVPDVHELVAVSVADDRCEDPLDKLALKPVASRYRTVSSDFNERSGYSTRSQSAFATWRKIPVAYIEEVTKEPLTDCNVTMRDNAGDIYSPQYPGPPGQNSVCIWRVVSPTHMVVHIWFNYFGLDEHCTLTVIHDDGVTDVITGRHSFWSKGHIMRLALACDGESSPRGFSAAYHFDIEIIPYTSTDYAMAAVYRGALADRIYFSRLASPIERITGPHCLKVAVYTSGDLNVTGVTVVTGVTRTRPLFHVSRADTPVWAVVTADVNGDDVTMSTTTTTTKTPVAFHVIFESRHDARRRQYGVVIDDVILTPGTCGETYAVGTINCTFDERLQCGYIDVSEGPQKWTRSYNETRSVHELAVTFRPEGDGATSRVTSPQMTSPLSDVACVGVTWWATVDVWFGVSVVTGNVTRRVMSHVVMTTEASLSSREIHVQLAVGDDRLLLEGAAVEGRLGVERVELWNGTCSSRGYKAAHVGDPPWYAAPQRFNASRSRSPEDPSTDEPTDVTGDDVTQQNSYEMLIDTLNRPLGQFRRQSLLPEAAFRDVLLKCTWDGKTCPASILSFDVADIGQCITISAAEDYPLQMTSTGPSHGLSLILDLQNYDALREVDTINAMKVHLYASHQHTLTDDRGINVAPGLLTELKLQHTKSTTLEAPYGNCGERVLKYFPGLSYQRANCVREVTTDDMVGRCGCKKVDMPGSMRVCSLKEFLDCEVRNQGNTSSAARDFDRNCPADCERSEYDATISHSRLAPSFFHTLFPAPGVAATGGKDAGGTTPTLLAYHDAISTRQRVDASLACRHAELMLRTYGRVDELIFFLQQSVLDHDTSDLGRVERGMAAFARFADDDLTERLFAGTGKELEAYEGTASYGPAVSWLGAVLASEVAAVRRALDGEEGDGRLREVEAAGVRARDALAQVHYARWHHDPLPYATTTVVTAWGSTDCEWLAAQWQSLSGALANVTQLGPCPAAAAAANASCRHDAASLRRVLTLAAGRLPPVLARLRRCWHAFPAALVRANTRVSLQLWYAERRLGYAYTHADLFPGGQPRVHQTMSRRWCTGNYANTSRCRDAVDDAAQRVGVERAAAQASLLRRQFGSTRLLHLYQRYAANATTMMPLARQLIAQHAAVSTSLRAAVVTVRSRLTRPALRHVGDVHARAATAYTDAIAILIRLQRFHHRDLMPSLARLALWRYPQHDFDAGSIALRAYSNYENTHEYGDSKTKGPLTAQHFAEDVAVMLQGFFDGLTRRVAQVDSRLIELVEATQTAMDEYDVILKTIVDSGRLDEHFVRTNLVQVNIFFSEFKHVELEQQKEYNLAAFFGDFGGYMGLLLGASAVTIVEVVDFLIVSLTSGYEPQHDDDDVENTGEKRRRSTKLRRATGCNASRSESVSIDSLSSRQLRALSLMVAQQLRADSNGAGREKPRDEKPRDEMKGESASNADNENNAGLPPIAMDDLRKGVEVIEVDLDAVEWWSPARNETRQLHLDSSITHM